MTPPLRPLPRSRLAALAPSLCEGHALVALVRTTDDQRWAGEAAWAFARAAAGPEGGRRVVLIDLDLDSAALHRVVRAPAAPGIAEAFDTGAPLSGEHQDRAGVWFIPAGSGTGSAARVWANPRWTKLRNGFKAEQALLLVYLPVDALAQFGATPDGVVALAGDAEDPCALPPETANLALGRIIDAPASPAAAAPSGTRPAPRLRARPRPLVPALVAVGCAVLGLGTWAMLAHSERWREEPGHVAVPAATIVPAAGPATWTIQLAAYGTLQRAVAHADRLAAQGVGAFVSPLPPDAHGVIWYRVQAGAYSSREAADTARTGLWSRGLAATGQGDLLLAPFSLAVEPPTHPERLREQGLVGVRWGSTGPLVVGAFETPEQAEFAAAALRAAGVQTTLVTRMGTHS